MGDGACIGRLMYRNSAAGVVYTTLGVSPFSATGMLFRHRAAVGLLTRWPGGRMDGRLLRGPGGVGRWESSWRALQWRRHSAHVGADALAAMLIQRFARVRKLCQSCVGGTCAAVPFGSPP